MKGIKNFLTMYLFLTIFSLLQVHAMDKDDRDYDFEYALKRREKVLAPWAQRTKEAEGYMNQAIKSGVIQIVEEEFKGEAVKTTFYPDTKMVDLHVGILHESIGFNFFIRWLDTSISKEKKSKKVVSKKTILTCGLQ